MIRHTTTPTAADTTEHAPTTAVDPRSPHAAGGLVRTRCGRHGFARRGTGLPTPEDGVVRRRGQSRRVGA
ncbi:hypothetical protein, partial [Nocardia sp. CC201C]|uniref:hypothetical protein n=1 Tax=Nocardia sp. CC201C TaxID=3044575 RepID=UPI0024A8EA42